MTLFVPMLAAALPEVPTFAQNLQYQVAGLLVVLFSLGSMALVVWLTGKLFVMSGRRKAASAKVPAVQAAEIPGEIYAAIAAAVSVAMEDRHFVIYGVRSADPGVNLAWGAEGRRSIYASRKLR